MLLLILTTFTVFCYNVKSWTYIYYAKKETLHGVLMVITSPWNNVVYVCKCYMKLGSNICEFVTASVTGFLKMKVKFEVKRHRGRFQKSQKCEEMFY